MVGGNYLILATSGIVLLTTLIHPGGAIKCWECNSHHDRNCADPFQNYTISYTDCNQRYLSHYPNTKASLCRKIIQKVNDDYRYIRGCGWLTESREGLDCIKRAGTFQVFIQYCHCETDGCNLASSIQVSFLVLSISFVVLMLVNIS